ncbi:hypothetical protein, partial [Klebsiella variicola]|uniref:hypothetical protein n=1 Tax=Klebsiella variicola TaxID=244366 RepID=UPI002B0617FB
ETITHPDRGANEGINIITSKIKFKKTNKIRNKIDSGSGTTIYKASLKSGAFLFSGYSRFPVVAVKDICTLS